MKIVDSEVPDSWNDGRMDQSAFLESSWNVSEVAQFVIAEVPLRLPQNIAQSNGTNSRLSAVLK